jgi:hypothetical protein
MKSKIKHVVNEDGTEYWYLDNEYHREDGPAVIWPTGYQSWWIHGQRHRIDGPACEWPNGTKEFWINGVQLTEKEFKNRNKIPSIESIAKQVLFVETMETRLSDSLDFYSVAIWQIKEALELAYKAGQDSNTLCGGGNESQNNYKF